MIFIKPDISIITFNKQYLNACCSVVASGLSAANVISMLAV